MKTPKRYLKYIAASCAVVLLVTASLLLLEAWENRNRFDSVNTENGIVLYNGVEYVKKENIETVLVLGLDKFEDPETKRSGDQADFLMLFVFDNDSKKYSAVHINRDTMANVNRLDISGNKLGSDLVQIALAYNYGYDNSEKVNCRNTADAVSELLLDISVDHYLSVTMDSVSVVNDLVGGVEVTVLDDFSGIDETLIKGEKVTLMGNKALTYVRTRYGLEDSTNSTRMARQKQYIDALHDKAASLSKEDEEFVLKMVDKLDDYVVYDFTDFRMKEFAEKLDQYEYEGILDIEGETKLGEEFIEFYPEEESIQRLVIDLFYNPKG